MERSRLEGHLADCRECRLEVAAVRRMLRARSYRSPMILLPASLAAAAAIAFVALNIQQGGPESSAERVRTPNASFPTDASARIDVRYPTDGDTIRLGKPALVWSAVTGEPTYRLTLTDASGQTLWTSTTTDTTLTLPAQVLHPRATYFWYVDALRSDGRAASTGVRSFTTP
jgi:hypothetical protein